MAKSTVDSDGWRGRRGPRPLFWVNPAAWNVGQSVSEEYLVAKSAAERGGGRLGFRCWPSLRRSVGVLAAVSRSLLWTRPPALACGGFFCTTTPVDQNAERIIFTQNGDGTVSAYVQIEYTGSAPDFSWILPLPEAIDVESVQVPEDAMAAFHGA